MNNHNIWAIVFAVISVAWSQVLVEVGSGALALTPEGLVLFRILAAAFSAALSALTPYFKLADK